MYERLTPSNAKVLHYSVGGPGCKDSFIFFSTNDNKGISKYFKVKNIISKHCLIDF